MSSCPECGFIINASTTTCSYCGNSQFHIKVDSFWDYCDRCGTDDPAKPRPNENDCPACLGEGFRKYRIHKDARDGKPYYKSYNHLLLKYREGN